MLEHIAGGVQDFTDMISHVPTQLLAVDADYPGRQSEEEQRETARRAHTLWKGSTGAEVIKASRDAAPRRKRTKKTAA